LKDNFDREKGFLEKQLADEKHENQRLRKDHTAEIARLGEENAKQLSEIEKLEGERENLLVRIQTLESRVNEYADDLTQYQRQTPQLTQTIEGLKYDLDRERREVARLNDQLKKEKEKNDRMSNEYGGLDALVSGLRDDLDVARGRYAQLENTLKAQSEEMSNLRQTLEPELRKLFQKQLEEDLKLRQDQLEQETESAQTHLREFWESKVNDKNAEIKELSRQLEQIMEKWKQEGVERAQLMTAFRKREEEKDRTLNQLINTNIAQQHSLQQYRKLLETEEKRLGYSAPVSRNEVPVATFLISGMDLAGHCIQIRNSSVDTLSLRGWRLRSRATGKEFKFPDVHLKGGQSLTVWSGEDSTRKEKFPSDLAWNHSFEGEGDTAELITPAGLVESKVDVISQD